jgi:hypothetical protein
VLGITLGVGMAVASAGSAGAVGPPPWSPAFQPAPDPTAAELDLIGTWNGDIADDDGLCVTILVPDWVPDRSNVVTEIESVLGDWETAVNPTGLTNDLQLTNGSSEGDGTADNCAADVDVTIVVAHGGGLTQGTTSFDGDSNGFITGAHIKIQAKFTGTNNGADQIGLIARHEFGHALGLGHWDISEGLLMSPLLSDNTGLQPNQCEVDAVVVAQHWYFNGDPQPAHFDADSDPYICDVTLYLPT